MTITRSVVFSEADAAGSGREGWTGTACCRDGTGAGTGEDVGDGASEVSGAGAAVSGRRSDAEFIASVRNGTNNKIASSNVAVWTLNPRLPNKTSLKE